MVRGLRGWRSSMVERLICNQQVAGSSPIASSREDIFQSGEVPKWPKGADCKSAGAAFGGSNPPLSTICPQDAGIAQWPEHQPSKLRVAGSSPVSRSSYWAHVAQLVEHFLGKEEVHRFDPGRGLHFCLGAQGSWGSCRRSQRGYLDRNLDGERGAASRLPLMTGITP